MTIEELKAHGWYEVTQTEYKDEVFEGELSAPGGSYLFHPCVKGGKDGAPIKGFYDFFYEDIVEPLEEKGLVVDLEEVFPPLYPLFIGDHPSVFTGDL
jgi:hypothetical protein